VDDGDDNDEVDELEEDNAGDKENVP